MTSNNPDISFILPVYNEQDSIKELAGEVLKVADEKQLRVELLFIDDGSTDQSAEQVRELMITHDEVGLIGFRRNFGKAAALSAGFSKAIGDIIVTMDGDLQDNPFELQKLLDALETADCVSGWKADRHDPIDKTLPSRIFNAVVGRVSGIKMHDFNCGYKAYRREAIEQLDLYGEMHRFIPVLLHWQGFRVAEVAIEHRARKFGSSKYGFSRILKGFFDLLTVILTTRFRTRPLHIFGTIGLLMSIIGFAVLAYLSVLWFMDLGPIGNRPMLFFGMLMLILGANSVGIGLVAEFVQNATSHNKPSYFVRDFQKPASRG